MKVVAPTEVQIWQADLSARRLGPGGWSPDEIDRASRFRFVSDRKRFLAARAVLRHVLGRHLDRDPASICFSYGPNGKPELTGAKTFFNLTHSGDLCLVAVAPVDVGIDVERAGARPHAELRSWVRREAWVKATGRGLAEVSGEPGPGWCLADLPSPAGYVAAAVVRSPAVALTRRDLVW